MSRSVFSPLPFRLGGAWLASLASLVLSASACNPEDTVEPVQPQESAVPASPAALEDGDVAVRDGMLAFANDEAFERVFGELQNQDREAADAWERKLGFVSQRQLFDRLVDAEYAYLVAPYEKLSDEELAKMEPPVGHTGMYEDFLKKGLIREVVLEGEPTYDYNLPTPSMARVLNAEGFVAIGDTVYQVKGDETKEAKSALSSPVASTQAQGMVKSFAVVNKTDGWKTINKRRGFLQVQMVPTFYNPWPHKKVQIKYEVNVKSQNKNFWGNWVYASCPNEVWISGSWTLALDYMALPWLGYWYTDYYSRSYSYPHPNCINNFYGSINPTSGTTIPYPGLTVITINASNRAFSDVRVSPMNWQASVPGGSSGIHLQVTN